MDKHEFVFIDIDTQKDLVEHFGAKAIPYCPEIRENLMELMSFAIRNNILVLSPIWTEGGDKVLDAECEIRANFGEETANTQQVFFEHDGSNPFTNPNLMPYLQRLNPKNVVLFGVPLESSVREAVVAMADQDWKIWLIRDCVKGYTEEDPILQELRQQQNVSLMSTRNTLKYLSELVYGHQH